MVVAVGGDGVLRQVVEKALALLACLLIGKCEYDRKLTSQ